MKLFCKDVLVGSSNGYKFELYYGPRKNGDEHTPPHLHAYYNNRYGKFCICNSYKGGIGDMFEGTMKPKEQAFVKEWIIRYKSKLNRRWRSQNFTRVDSSPASEIKNAQRLIDAIEDIESRLKKLRTKLLLRKMELYASEASSSLTF